MIFKNTIIVIAVAVLVTVVITSTELIAFEPASVILAVIIFGIVARVTFLNDGELLRAGPKGTNGEIRPYSFGKFQIWLWTLVIGPAFCINWGFHNDQMPDPIPWINETSSVLLAISGASTIASLGIATSQEQSKAAGKAPTTMKIKSQSKTSDSFFTDILMDDSGQISVARLQNFIFTISYVAIYITMFIREGLTYPDFDSTAYTLMGISTGTYVLGKSINR